MTQLEYIEILESQIGLTRDETKKFASSTLNRPVRFLDELKSPELSAVIIALKRKREEQQDIERDRLRRNRR